MKPLSNSKDKDKTPIKVKPNEDMIKKIPLISSDFNEEMTDKKQLTEVRKERPNFSSKDESPWTKFCKSDLSPLCKNNLLSPNKQTNQNDSFSQAK